MNILRSGDIQDGDCSSLVGLRHILCVALLLSQWCFNQNVDGPQKRERSSIDLDMALVSGYLRT